MNRLARRVGLGRRDGVQAAGVEGDADMIADRLDRAQGSE